MRQRILLPILSFLLAAIPSCVTAQSIENATIEREEYAVYSAVIPSYAYEETGTFVIENPTTRLAYEVKLERLQFFLFPNAPRVALSQETLDDFTARNKTNRWLTPKLEMNREYRLVDVREIIRLAGDMGQHLEKWTDFFKEYPSTHGFVSLSRVGFNRQMDQALVHIGWRCPGLCGHWSLLVLTKQDGVWNIISEANRVVS
jgi:hypothetical protein